MYNLFLHQYCNEFKTIVKIMYNLFLHQYCNEFKTIVKIKYNLFLHQYYNELKKYDGQDLVQPAFPVVKAYWIWGFEDGRKSLFMRICIFSVTVWNCRSAKGV